MLEPAFVPKMVSETFFFQIILRTWNWLIDGISFNITNQWPLWTHAEDRTKDNLAPLRVLLPRRNFAISRPWLNVLRLSCVCRPPPLHCRRAGPRFQPGTVSWAGELASNQAFDIELLVIFHYISFSCSKILNVSQRCTLYCFDKSDVCGRHSMENTKGMPAVTIVHS